MAKSPTDAPEPNPPRQPTEDELSEALARLDPAVVRGALTRLGAEFVAEPPPEPDPPPESASLAECNGQTIGLHRSKAEEELRLRKLVQEAMKTGATGREGA